MNSKRTIRNLAFAVTVGLTLGLCTPATAAIMTGVITDDFDRGNGPLAGSTTPVGGATWVATYVVDSNRALASENNFAAYVPYSAPTDRIYSVEAVTERVLDGAGNHSTGIGFTEDVPGPPPLNAGACSGLTLAINIAGEINISDDVWVTWITGKTMADVGLTGSYTGPVPLLLEYDPVNEIVRAEVNGIEVYNLSYTINAPVTFAGFYHSNTGGGSYDDFAIKEIPEPTTLCLLGLGSLALLRRRR